MRARLLPPKIKLPIYLCALMLGVTMARPDAMDSYGGQYKRSGGFGMGTDVDEASYARTSRSSRFHAGTTSGPYNYGGSYSGTHSGSHTGTHTGSHIGSGAVPGVAGSGHPIGSGAGPSYTDSLLTKSAEINGVLMCGDVPATDVIVRFYRNKTEIVENLLTVITNKPDGSFKIEAHTGGRGADESSLIPRIRFFHKCDDGEKVKGYRSFGFTVEDVEYVSLGKMARKPFDIGKLNIQLIYPGEKRDTKYTNEQPLGAPI